MSAIAARFRWIPIAMTLLLFGGIATTTSGCIVRTGHSHPHARRGHRGHGSHSHCHYRGRHGRRVCHAHPHGGGHH